MRMLTRTGFRGGLSIVGDDKRNYTQLEKAVYEIVYNLCNLLIFSVFCGDKEIRTPDPLLAKQVLYQLSYNPKSRPARS